MSERFFLDHGMIHDRMTGKHVTTDDVQQRGGTAETLALLNDLVGVPPRDRMAWALARLHVEGFPDRYGLGGVEGFAQAHDAVIDHIATERAFRFETQVNHIAYWMERARRA